LTHHSFRFLRGLVAPTPRLTFAALFVAVLFPAVASATQSAELYRTQAYFYGRFEARIRHAPGEGVVSSFFLWKDGSSSTTSWNELDFEKINSTCHMQTNIWTGKGTQSAMLNTPTFDICADYHTYAFEWTPDYIAWVIDGVQVRKVTGASVTEYTQNASQGMTIHFNIWQGDSSFGGNLSTSTLPVHEYISWVQYSSYSGGTFQQQWREEFTGSSVPSGWMTGTWASALNHSTHNPANVTFANGIAVLSMTADNATGFSGTPPADGSSGAAGTTGTGGSGAGTGGTSGAGTGGAGRGGAGGGGRGGTGGTSSPGTGGMSSTGRGGTTGAGGTPAGAGGNGAGGVPAGAGGSGAGGSSVGAAGNGAGGDPAGTAGTSGTTSGAAGVSGTAGDSATGAGGAPATGGSPGTGGTPTGGGETPTGSGTGCACRTAGGDSTEGGGLLALLLLATVAVRRRSQANR
jgi:endo-1,3-1,4-beta-glycanase ExoK